MKFVLLGESDVQEPPLETIIGATIGGFIIIIAIIVCVVCMRRKAKHKYVI